MIVTVSGIENFVGNIKRRYRRDAPIMSEVPERHHAEFAKQLDGAPLIESGVIQASERHTLIDRLEADPRTLEVDLVTTPDGRISYRVWLLKPATNPAPASAGSGQT